MEELLDLFLGVGAPWPPEGRQQRVENHEAPSFVEDTTIRPYTIEPATRPRMEAHRERNSPYRSDARYASDLEMLLVVEQECIKLAKPSQVLQGCTLCCSCFAAAAVSKASRMSVLLLVLAVQAAAPVRAKPYQSRCTVGLTVP